MTRELRYLNYRQRLRAASKGEERPIVRGIQYNPEPNSVTNQAYSILLVAQPKQIRVYANNGWQWRMMGKFKFQEGEVNFAQWNPGHPTVFAVARKGAKGEVILELMKWLKDRRSFKRVKTHLVSKSGDLCSLSWSTRGTYLLVAVDFEGQSGRIFVFKNPSSVQSVKPSVVLMDYSDAFFTAFHPNSDAIFTVSDSEPGIRFYQRNNDQWIFLRRSPVTPRLSYICFNETGSQIAAFGFSSVGSRREVFVWECNLKRGADMRLSVSLKKINVEHDEGLVQF